MAVEKKEDDNNKTIHTSNTQYLLAHKLELTLIKTANKNKNGFINKIYALNIMCATHFYIGRPKFCNVYEIMKGEKTLNYILINASVVTMHSRMLLDLTTT